MNSDLKIDWATAQAARYACKHWHYSGKVPVFKQVRVGVWESGQFVGVVLFGQGATPNIGSALELDRLEVCELVRVALREHRAPVSRIVSIALRFLRRKCPGTRAVVSFADPTEGHHGGIYQAGNWIYLGTTPPLHVYRVHGVDVHPKTLHSRYGIGGQSLPWLRERVDPNAERVMLPGKHKYVYALDKSLRARFADRAQPYPKRSRAESVDSDTSANQAGEGGPIPTSALQVVAT